MSEHKDKGRVWVSSTEKSDIPPDLSLITERQQKEQEKVKEMEKKAQEALKNQIVELRRQWDVFVADTSVQEHIEKHGIEWADPGFLIQIFVADFGSKSVLLLEDDIFKKISSYAKIVSVSPHNEGPKKEWKVGDIVHMNDGLMNIQLNPHWSMWYEGQKAGGGQMMGKEPPKYVRKLYAWILDGKLYALDKGTYMLTNKYALLNEDSIRLFPGPFVFDVDTYEIGKRRVKGDPWA